MIDTLEVMLVSCTKDPQNLVASAAKVCYSDKNMIEVFEKVESDPEVTQKFVQKLDNVHHYSPFEHASFTFAIEGISRVVSHQLVRHRIASYSQKSQRYVKENGFPYVIPPSVKKAGPEAINLFVEAMDKLDETYLKLVYEKGVPKEDARYVLPNACCTNIVVTMNVRSLKNFFNLRCCKRAQWEIREMAMKMLGLVKKEAPFLFSNAGASCISNGFCPEGAMSCGMAPTFEEMKDGYEKYRQFQLKESWKNAQDMCSVEPEPIKEMGEI